MQGIIYETGIASQNATSMQNGKIATEVQRCIVHIYGGYVYTGTIVLCTGPFRAFKATVQNFSMKLVPVMYFMTKKKQCEMIVFIISA